MFLGVAARSGPALLNVQAFYQLLATGLIIIFAMLIDRATPRGGRRRCRRLMLTATRIISVVVGKADCTTTSWSTRRTVPERERPSRD